ncbi:hypothetical protein [Bacillus methanolicus]|uniref:hypothetical protein n=1 Tax=Bacillus methanolicus TaxID=1471 RepID=UPI00238082E3|nr:hypothetical protein [Bacillus methanolicus]
MEKVKLTPEQAEAIEFALNTERLAYYQNPDALLDSHIRSKQFLHELEPLKEIDNVTLAKALYIGYEVEPEFKVEDWVKFETLEGIYVYGKIEKINEFGSAEAQWSDGKGGGVPLYELERMTPEEISTEKERRKWETIGRKVGEYKTNDIVYHEKYGYGVYAHGQMIEPFNQEKFYGWFDVEIEELELICPAEHRFDLKEDE